MHARNRTWPLGASAEERVRQRILPIEGGDGSTLTLDFTTGILDPRLTFSRTSDATFINSSGLVQWADANHVQNSTMLNNTGTKWTQTTSGGTVTINGDGTVRFNGTGGRATWLQSIASLASGLPMTFSFRVTSFTNTNLRTTDLFNAGTGFTGQSYFYTDTTGTTHTLTAFESLPKSGTNGIGTYSVTATTNATSANIIFGSDCNGVGGRSGDVTITEPQLQYGTVVPRRVYVPNSSIIAAKWDSARFDHDPTTLAPRGLLIEGNATNYSNYSETFPTAPASGVGWNWSEVTANATLQTSPDGTTNAIAFNETTTAAALHRISHSVTAVAGALTCSVWVKVLDGSAPRRLFMNAVALMNVSALFDIDPAVQTGASGSAVNVAGTAANRAGTWVKYPNGWYRCSIVGTYNTATTMYLQLNRASSTTATDDYYTGSTSNGLMIWGFQLESGSGASSYIPTGASTGTRLQDQMQMTNLASLGFNTSAGTLTINGTYNKDANSAAYPRSIRFMGTSVQSMAMITSGKTLFGNTPNTSGGSYFEASRTLASAGAFKFGWTLTTAVNPALASATVSLNGSSTSITPLGQGAIVNPTSLQFLYGAGAATDYPSMNISSLKYWPYATTAADLNVRTSL